MTNRINAVTPKEDFRDKTHLNFMAGLSYDINDPFLRLRIAAASCFFGEPQYYRESGTGSRKPSGPTARYSLSADRIEYLRKVLDAIDPQSWRKMTQKEILEDSIDACLDADIEATLQVAVALRNEDHMRVTPQVVLVKAAVHPKAAGTGLISQYAPMILRRGDEPALQLAYFWSLYGKNGKRGDIAIPTRLRKAWKQCLEKLDHYQLAKYRLENRNVKTVDVVRLVHANSPAINKLITGELKTDGTTWEDVISNEGNTKTSWLKILPRMGHMGILRNIRNMIQAQVPIDVFLPLLKAGVEKGKQLPFRYYSAYREIERIKGVSGNVLDGIEECMVKSFANMPRFEGKVMSLVDNSGSAKGATTSEMGTMQVATIGNLMGIMTGMASDDGYVGVFGDDLAVVPVRKTSSIFDQLKQVDKVGDRIGAGTETGVWLFFDRAIKNREHWDYVFVYSDMQAGHGGLYASSVPHGYVWQGTSVHIDVPKLIATYRSTVNPNVKVFLVQIAGYTDTLLPEFYKNTYILGGWSANIIRFAHAMSQFDEPKIQPKQKTTVKKKTLKARKITKRTRNSVNG